MIITNLKKYLLEANDKVNLTGPRWRTVLDIEYVKCCGSCYHVGHRSKGLVCSSPEVREVCDIKPRGEVETDGGLRCKYWKDIGDIMRD